MVDVPKYRTVSEIAGGGMGRIYKGALVGQAGFQRPIVIKQLRALDDPSHVHLFVEEARRYALLDHENIGRIFDFDDVDGQLCIILEYIDGWSLVEYLERHRQVGRLPDAELSVFIASRVCRALQYVFERAAIVHHDISPSNIMITREGTVKLIDFGIATQAGSRESGLTGKPAYMAPEMVVELRADNRSDLFSLGAVLYEMLTLTRLFMGRDAAHVLEQVIAARIPSPLEVNPGIPGGVLTILRTALQRDPALRYGSAGEMGEACEHFLYDKGYGPTNLTLKQYLADLFPAAPADPGRVEAPGEALHVEPTLVRIGEAAGDATPVTAQPRPRTAAETAPPDDSPTAAPPAQGPRPRRIRRRP